MNTMAASTKAIRSKPSAPQLRVLCQKKDRRLHQEQYKTHRAAYTPSDNKSPRVAEAPSEHSRPEFKTEQMDMEGHWGCGHLQGLQIQKVLQRIFECQKLTWQELQQTKSHLVNVADLVPEAQKRLDKIKKDDLDQLYSLRLSGRERIWGIKEGNIFWLFCWDPGHEVCLSHKKHT
jgi:hypothetical protein